MKRIETVDHNCDILVVGGGLAGCMAAIRAGELNDNVILADKSNPERSGCAATGIDHIWGYFPEVQQAEGASLEDMVDDHAEVLAKGLINREVLHYICATSLDRILDLERFGAKIRFDDSTLPGKFRLQYQVHSYRNTLHFDGRDIKRILTDTVRKRGVTVADRIMVTDLLTHDGQIAGAVGYGTRDGRLHVFHAKAVIMACGRPNRLFRTPAGLVFNHRMPPAMTGDGKAAMFRAGADIINMEFISIPGRWSSKNFVRGGGLPGGSYQPPGIGLNGRGEVVRPRNHDVVPGGETWRGKATASIGWGPLMKELAAGRGPIWADMSWGSEEDQAYMRWAIANEGTGTALLHVMDQYGLDFRRHKIEIWPIEPEISAGCSAGPIVDAAAQTSVPGLFAAGDEAGGLPGIVAPGALTMGHLCAESAAAHCRSTAAVPDGGGLEPVRAFCDAIAARGEGDPWMDAQETLQNIMSDYSVHIRSETMAQRGLECLDYLEETMRLTAANPHEMTHCLEIRSLIECGRMVLRGTVQRKESRGNIFKRLDYPERDDDNYFCFLGQRLVDGDIVYTTHPV